jgi:hypothetical protein
MTPAQAAAFVAAAKRIAIPVVSCVRADLRFGHLTGNQSREGLLALIAVLAECADPAKLKAVTEAPGDEGLAPLAQEDVLRRAHAERTRLERAGLPVPFQVRAMAAEYRQGVNARYRERKKQEGVAA